MHLAVPVPLVVGGAIIAAIQAALFVFVAVNGVRRATTWLFLGMLTASALGLFPTVVFALMDADEPPWGTTLRSFFAVALFSLSTAFAVTYPRWARRGMGWPAAWAFLPTLFITALVAVAPGTLVADQGGPTPFLSGFAATLFALNWLPAAWIFAYHWLRSTPGAYRSQFMYLLLVSLIWSLNDGIGATQRASHLMPTEGSLFPPLADGFNLLRLVTVALIVLMILVRIVRGMRSGKEDLRARREHWIVLGGTLLAYPLSFLQFAGGPDEVVVRLIHFYVDGAALLLFAYGILRAQLFDIDLKVKWTLHRGAVISTLAAIFFLIKESIEFLLPVEGLIPTLAGAALVSVLVLPAWRAAGKLMDRAMPGVSSSPAYLDDRRRAIYGAALEGAVADGEITSKEREMLLRLQRELGIVEKDASRLEREVWGAATASSRL